MKCALWACGKCCGSSWETEILHPAPIPIGFQQIRVKLLRQLWLRENLVLTVTRNANKNEN